MHLHRNNLDFVWILIRIPNRDALEYPSLRYELFSKECADLRNDNRNFCSISMVRNNSATLRIVMCLHISKWTHIELFMFPTFH
jgi:hypothetical protein